MENISLKNHKVELLAPAGNADCALAAFDAGADAIYAGLKKFNARERTDNFSFDEMGKIISYAGKNGRKVYVTFNTLVKEGELDEAARFLCELEQLRPDAVIVQDIGIVRMIREYFPRLTVHASTQMGLHNSAGLSFAEKLGITRVILERQTTLDEISAMMKTKPARIELEMFVHGALCCCVSGSCLLSSWLGGWSGNRGKCKQPCRRRHHSEKGNGFFLSTQDLCMLDMVPEIVASGVASLKIEGRLRRADYVTNVVSAYSLALEAADDPEKFREILPKAREILSRTGGRRWSHGFYTAESAKELVKHDSLGASGLLCGKVLRVAENGFTVGVTRRLHLGDMLRVQPLSGDEGPALTITKMSRSKENVTRALKGEECFIHSDKKVEKGALVYKTGASATDYSNRIAALPERKTLADIKIAISRSLVSIDTSFGNWSKNVDFAEASNRKADGDSIKNEFKILGCANLAIGDIELEITENPFIPSSVLKGIRRDFREWLDETASFDPVARDAMEGFERYKSDYNDFKSRSASPDETFADAAIMPVSGREIAIPSDIVKVYPLNDKISPDVMAQGELLLPFFVPESQLDYVKRKIASYVESGGRCVRISSLHQFELLKDIKNLKIRTNAPLPACNSMAVEELGRLGASTIQAHLELEKDALERLAAKSRYPLELYRYGRPILLTTRAELPVDGEITDARGNAFRIVHDGIFTELVAEKVMDIPFVDGFASSIFDFRLSRRGEKDTADFNFNHIFS